jgi:hypothetical protein
VTLAQVLANIVFACGLERTSRDGARIFTLANPVSSMHMTIEVRPKSELVIALLAQVWFRMGFAMLTAIRQRRLNISPGNILVSSQCVESFCACR